MREMQGQLGPTKGKDFDTGNILGPWLVTADEVTDPYNLTMVARVNGEEWSRGNSGTMHHKFEDMIAYVSADETLHAGRVLRLRHGRQRLRARAGTLPQAERRGRAGDRRARRAAQPVVAS